MNGVASTFQTECNQILMYVCVCVRDHIKDSFVAFYNVHY